MSYEIRTPLNGIVGMADVLSRYDFSKEVNDIVRSNASFIRSSA